MVTSLVQRLISIQFSGNTNVTISGHRASALVIATGEAGMCSANCRIFGMSQQQMNSLSTLGMKVIQIQDRDTLTIQAGDSQSGLSTIFTGTITNAWADYQASPQVVFNVESKTGMAAAVKSVTPTSIQGSADVGNMMSNLASKAGFNFQNNGVTKALHNPYLWGSARDQMWQIVKAANIEWHIDHLGVGIWPRNGFRSNAGIVISPTTGMVGYPAFRTQGVVVKVLYNPNIVMGSMVTIQGSSVTPANGNWKVYMLQHKLEAYTPRGQWFTTLGLYDPAFGSAPVTNTGT